MVMTTKRSCCTKSRSSRKKTEKGRKEKSFGEYKVDFQLARLRYCTGADGSLCKSNKTDRLSFIARVLCHNQVARVL